MTLRALAIALLLSSPAAAADLAEPLPAAPAHDWTGLYLGAQIGATLSGGHRDDITGDLNLGLGDDDLATLIDATGGRFFQSDDAAFLGGIHVGYDQQIGSLVLGVVADIGYSDAAFRSGASSDLSNASGSIEQSLDYLGSGRLRAGYAVDQVLVYATGGFAFAGASSDLGLSGGFDGLDSRIDGDDTLFGYTVGGGVDVAVSEKVSIGAQYLYTRFEDASATASVANPFGGPDYRFKTSDTIDLHRIEAKVSYHFN